LVCCLYKTWLGKKVALSLTKKGIENYCPLNRIVRQWSNFKKVIYKPLFTSYVFIRFSEVQRKAVLKTSGIMGLVYWRDKPAVIENKELEVMREFLEEYQCVYLEPAPVTTNAAIKVISSPLKYYFEGILAVKDNLIKIILPSLGYIMVAVVQKPDLEMLHQYNHRFFEINLQ
jgi:transcription antitermination factor NusG